MKIDTRCRSQPFDSCWCQHSLAIKLGHARAGKGIVCCWPKRVAQRKQAPIVLRLIEISDERGTIYLVTNVLNQRKLSNEVLSRLYTLRWRIELHFRAVKQTFGRSKLRSRNSEHALAELDWSLVALTMVQLFAVREQIKVNEPPENTSVSAALQAIRHAMDNWHQPAHGKNKLTLRLQTAIKDDYQRISGKASRYRRSDNSKPTASKPIVKQATAKQKRAYRELQNAA